MHNRIKAWLYIAKDVSSHAVVYIVYVYTQVAI